MAIPKSGGGPGVIVLHAWWELTGFFKELCDRLAQEGFVAVAPDRYHDATASTIAEAKRLSLPEARLDAAFGFGEGAFLEESFHFVHVADAEEGDDGLEDAGEDAGAFVASSFSERISAEQSRSFRKFTGIFQKVGDYEAK